MIYHIKIYTGSADGGVTDLAGAVLVFADNESEAYDKAKSHWHDFIKAEGYGVALDAVKINAEVIIP